VPDDVNYPALFFCIQFNTWVTHITSAGKEALFQAHQPRPALMNASSKF